MGNKLKIILMLSLFFLNTTIYAQFRPKGSEKEKPVSVPPKASPKPVAKPTPKPSPIQSSKVQEKTKIEEPALVDGDGLFLMYRDPSTPFPESKKYTVDRFIDNEGYVTVYFIYNERKVLEKKIMLNYHRLQNYVSCSLISLVTPVYSRVVTIKIADIQSFELTKDNSTQESLSSKLVDYNFWFDQDKNFIHVFSLSTNEFSVKNIEEVPSIVHAKQNQESLLLQQRANEEKAKEEDALRERIKQQLMDSINKVEADKKLLQQRQDSLEKYYFSKVIEASSSQNELLVSKVTDLLVEKNQEEEFDYFNKYMLTVSMIVNRQGKPVKISFADSNTINRKLINRAVIEYLQAKTFPTQTEKLDGKEYSFSTQYDFKIPIQKKFANETWLYISKTKLINKETKNNIAESSYNDFVNSFKKRPWKGRYGVAQSILTIGEYKLNTIRQTTLKRAYCLQIAFNFGMLPYNTANTEFDFDNSKFFVPSVSLIYRWFGVYYGFGYYAGDYTSVGNFQFVQPLPSGTRAKLMSKINYHEGGVLLNIGSCFYLKGGICYNKMTIIHQESNGYVFYNKTFREQYGFTAALCIYPRFFNLEVGYNHIYRSPYLAAGFNIPIKL